MDREEVGFSTRNWVDSAQDRDYGKALVNSALNLRVQLVNFCFEYVNSESIFFSYRFRLL